MVRAEQQIKETFRDLRTDAIKICSLSKFYEEIHIYLYMITEKYLDRF